MTRRQVLRRDVDGLALRDELSARLGRAVELVIRRPTDDDPDGELLVEDRATGERLDLDPDVVAGVLAAHVVEPGVSSERAFLAEFDAAHDVGGKLDALRGYIARAADLEDQRRARADDHVRRPRPPGS